MHAAALRESLHRAGYIADEALAQSQDRVLVRLQCHEGLDLAQAAYEWNCGRQLLAFRLQETQGDKVRESDLFDRSHLLERPLLQAISSEQPCVLLIDEIDRTDAACTTGSTTRRGRANSPSCAPHGLAPKVS